MLDTLSKFNDTLALIVISVIVLLWGLHGYGLLKLPGEVIGATIMGFTLVIQFYYRKSAPETDA